MSKKYNKNVIKNSINDLCAKREEIKDITQEILRKLGWEYKTSIIDFCWYWYKDINGITYALNENNALALAIRQFQDENINLYLESDEYD